MSITAVTWKLGPYERIPETPHPQGEDLQLGRLSKIDIAEPLFKAVIRNDHEWVKGLENLTSVVNCTKKIRIPMESLEPEVAKFYATVSPVTADTKRVEPESMEIPTSSISIKMPALSLTLFVPYLYGTEPCYTLLHVLIDAGARLHATDSTGLSAYDHARILKLDQSIIDRLYPFTDVRSSTPDNFINAIRSHDTVHAYRYLEEKVTPLDLDARDMSPIALALYLCPSMIPKLLESGFSPFAVYKDGSERYHSLAYAVAIQHEASSPSLLVTYFRNWVHTTDSSYLVDIDLLDCVQIGLDIVRRASGKSYAATHSPGDDALAFSVLLGHERSGRACLGQGSLVPGSFDWPMYAAIRTGQVRFVEMLLEHVDATLLEPFGGTFWKDDHFLASWWPYPCACSADVHTIFSRTICEYISDLQCKDLCPPCKTLRPKYRKILRVLGHLRPLQRQRQNPLRKPSVYVDSEGDIQYRSRRARAGDTT